MRWYILRALLAKEVQRHLANRGGIALALLLVAAAVLLSVFAPEEAAGGTGMVGVFRPLEKADTIDGVIVYPTGTGAIQIRQVSEPGRRPAVQVYVWHPDGDP